MQNAGIVAARATVALGVLAASVLASARPALAYDKHACVAASDSAQAFRIDGKLLKAREQLLVCADPSCPSIVQAACARWIAGLDAQIPTVVVHLREADGRDAVGFQVQMDGKPLERGASGGAVAVDPGPHELRFIAADGRTKTESLVIAAGDQLRRIDGMLPPRAGDTAPAAPAAASADGGGSSTTPWAAWGAATVGAVAAGTSAGLAISGNHDYQQVKGSSACAHADCSSQYPTAKFVAADVALGVAIVAAGVSAVLFFTHKSLPTAIARTAPALTEGITF